MYRGTTPTYTFTLPDDVDLTQATKVYVTFSTDDKSEKELATWTNADDAVTVSEHSVELYLTQEETLALPDGKIKVQLNWLYNEGSLTKRAASKKTTIKTERNLLDEVLV